MDRAAPISFLHRAHRFFRRSRSSGDWHFRAATSRGQSRGTARARSQPLSAASASSRSIPVPCRKAGP